jgi:CheY-like chemotaxis protein
MAAEPVSVLLVSAHLSDRAELQRILAHGKWRLYVRTTCPEALAFLQEHRVPVVICDGELTASDWRRILGGSAALPDPPCVIVSSRLADERLWAEVLNLGGYDVLYTPFDADEVLRVSWLAWQFWQRERGADHRSLCSVLAEDPPGRRHKTIVGPTCCMF